jgi:amino acid transporter
MYGPKASLAGISATAALPATGLAIGWYLLAGVSVLLVGMSLVRMSMSRPRRGRHTRQSW